MAVNGKSVALKVTGRSPRALGGLRAEEQNDPSAKCQVLESLRCPLIRAPRIRCAQRSGESGAHCIESHPWRRMPAPAQTTRCCASLFDDPNRLWCWLARKDSNLRSPDQESVARNQPREPPFERAAGLCRPPNRGESGCPSRNESDAHSDTERVCSPIWASRFYPDPLGTSFWGTSYRHDRSTCTTTLPRRRPVRPYS